MITIVLEESQIDIFITYGQEDPLEEEMATHYSILAWRTPWTEDPGGLQSLRSQGWTRLSVLSQAVSSPWSPF